MKGCLTAFYKGEAVGALSHRGIRLMRAHADFIQGTVVVATAMVGTLGHSTFNAPIGFAGIHGTFSSRRNTSLIVM